MDEKQLQLLWDLHAKKNGGFSSFGEFIDLMKDSNSRKVYFDNSNKDLGYNDYNEFEQTLKKKDGGNTSQNGGQPSRLTSALTNFTPEQAERPLPQPTAKVKDTNAKVRSTTLNPLVALEETKGNAPLPQSKQKSSTLPSQSFTPKSTGFDLSRVMQPVNIADAVDMDKVREENANSQRAGYMLNKFLSGASGVGAGLGDLAVQGLMKILPNDPNVSNEQALKNWREEATPLIRESLKNEYGVNIGEKEKQYDAEFFTSAVGGLFSSLVAMGSYKGLSLFPQAYDSGLQSINSTEQGAALPESTKSIFGVGVGMAQATLEKIGLDKIFGKQGSKVATNLALQTFKNLAKTSKVPITAEVFEAALEVAGKDLKKRVYNMGGKIFGAGLIEFTTGSAQELSTIFAEDITNAATGKNVFEATSWGDRFGRVVKAGAQEAVGGGILGTASIPFSKTRNIISEKVAKAKSPEDIQSLKDELATSFQEGLLVEEEAQKVDALIDDYVRVHSKIPDTVPNRKVAADKILEREEIEATIVEKTAELQTVDAAFQKDIEQDLESLQGRVEEINNEIANPEKSKLSFEDKARQTYPALETIDDAGVNAFMKENATDSPTQFIENFGQEKFDEIVNDIPTEELQSKLDLLIKYASDSPNVDILDGIIAEREKQSSPLSETVGNSDAGIEKRMAEIEGDKTKQDEFNSLEKEMEKRERATVFSVPLEKVNDAVDALVQKEKDKPNGFGSFIEKRDARETKEVADKYSNPKDISDADLKNDFKEAVLGNPDTWYADGLKLRESMKEASNRGIDTKELVAEIEKQYVKDGYTESEARRTVAIQLKPIFEGSKKVETDLSKQLPTVGNSEGVGDGETVAYHGSKSKFSEFNDDMVSSGEGGDLFGKGFYLTNNKNVADFYAHHVAKKDFIKEHKPTGIFKTMEPVFEDNADELASKNKQVNEFRITGKILDSENYIIDKDFKEFIINSFVKHNGFDRKTAESTFEFLKNNKSNINEYRGELEYVIKQLGMGNKDMVNEISDYIKKQGYDGVKYPSDKSYEGANSYNYVIYNKGAIKSVEQPLPTQELNPTTPQADSKALESVESIAKAFDEFAKDISDVESEIQTQNLSYYNDPTTMSNKGSKDAVDKISQLFKPLINRIKNKIGGETVRLYRAQETNPNTNNGQFDGSVLSFTIKKEIADKWANDISNSKNRSEAKVIEVEVPFDSIIGAKQSLGQYEFYVKNKGEVKKAVESLLGKTEIKSDTKPTEAATNPVGKLDKLVDIIDVNGEKDIITDNLKIETTKNALEDTENKDAVAKALAMVYTDAGFHRGELKGKSDYLQDGYSGDMPFTGYYFVSDPRQVVEGGSAKSNPKAFRTVDFSQYNLLKPTTPQYWALKSGLKGLLSNMADGIYIRNAIEDASGYSQVAMLKAWMPELAAKMVEANDKIMKSYYLWKELPLTAEGKERFETIILKELGYEGVDVRGLKSENGENTPDTFSHGSTLFDLKPNTVLSLSEAYHKAKSDGSNPKLVKAVEDAINNNTSKQSTNPVQPNNTETKGQGDKESVSKSSEPVGQGDAKVTPAVHARNIKDKFRETFKAKGNTDEHIDAAIALMDARARSWASEKEGRTADEWYQLIVDVKNGEFNIEEGVDVAYQIFGKKDLKTNILGKVTGIKDSSLKEINEELSAIERNAKRDGKWLVAPNGRATKLSPFMWKLVRTKRFKEWFGDWRRDAKNASKILDENGEPVVYFSGSKDKFNEFSKEYFYSGEGAMYYGAGFYFTPREKTAEGYSKQSTTNDYLNSVKKDGEQYGLDKINGAIAKIPESSSPSNIRDTQAAIDSLIELNESALSKAQKALSKIDRKANSKAFNRVSNFVSGARNSIRALKDIRTTTTYAFKQRGHNFKQEIDKALENSFFELKYAIDSKSRFGDEVGNVFNVFLNVRNPLNWENSINSDIVNYVKNKLSERGVNADFSRVKTGGGLYKAVAEALNEPLAPTKDVRQYKKTSEFFTSIGVDGIIHTTNADWRRGYYFDQAAGEKQVIVFEPNNIKSANENAGTFSKDSNKIDFQDAKGALETLKDGRVVIHALNAPDVSTMVHEIAHVFEKDLTSAEQETVKKNGGSEGFARGFERYLREGKSPVAEMQPLFEKFKQWLTSIYKTLKGSPIEKRISPKVRQIFDRLLTEQKNEKAQADAVQQPSKVSSDTKAEPDKATPKAEEAKTKEKRIEDFNKKADKVANDLIDFLTPKTTRGVNKSGMGVEEIVKGATEIIKKTYEATQNVKEAVEAGIEHFKKHWDAKELGELPEQALREKLAADLDVIDIGKIEREGGKNRDKGIMASMIKSVPESSKEKITSLRYQVASQAEAKAIGRRIVDEHGVDIALEYATNSKLDGDIRSQLFNHILNKIAIDEKAATNPEAKKALADKYAEVLMDYDESGRDAGRFISSISDFYKSPLGMEFYENKKREKAFVDMYGGKEKGWREVFEEMKSEPEFAAFVQAEVAKVMLKKEGGAKKAATNLRNLAAKVREKGITPDWLKADIKDANKSGIDTKIIDKAIASTLEAVANVIEIGGNIADVVAKEIKKLKNLGVTAKESEIEKWIYEQIGTTNGTAKTFGEKVAERISSLEKSIEGYKKKIADKDFDIKEEKVTSDKIVELESELKDVKKAYNEARKNFPAYKDKMSERYLQRMRNKLEGLSEKDQAAVITKTFKKLVEEGALEYDDFRNIIAETLGLGKMDAETAKNFKEYVEDINAVEAAKDKLVEEGTKESELALIAAEKKAIIARRELAKVVYNEVELSNTLRSALQLTAIGLPTIFKNITWNIVQQGFIKFPANAIIALADNAIYAGSKALGGKYTRDSSAGINAQNSFFKGLKEGTLEGVDALTSGVSSKDYFDKEIKSAPINPLQSGKDLMEWAKGNKSLKFKEVIDKMIKGGPTGYYMEMVSRGLTLFDKPLRFAAETSMANRIASAEMGLKGRQLDIFTRAPEQFAKKYFMDKGLSESEAIINAKVVLDRITEAGDKSVSQQSNWLSDAINRISEEASKKAEGRPAAKFAMGAGKVLGSPLTLFVKTPANVAWQVFNLVNPGVAFAQSAAFAVSARSKYLKGDATYKIEMDRAKDWMGTAIVGAGMGVVAAYLVKQGIIESDDDDDSAKERRATKEYSKAFTINISKMDRLMFNRVDDKSRPDLRVDLSWFGQIGAYLDLKQRMLEYTKSNPEATNVDQMVENLTQSSKIAMSSSVLNSASTISYAMSSYNGFKGYAVNTIGTYANIIQPSSFAQYSRAQLESDYRVKSDKFLEQLKNSFAARSSVLRKGELPFGVKVFKGVGSPPSDIGLWGDELKRSGSPALRFFGVTTTEKDNFAQPIFEDFERTNNAKFLPSVVDTDSFTVDGVPQKLTKNEARDLEIFVGQERKKLAAPYVNNHAVLDGYEGRYKALNDNDKLEALNVLYEMGKENGKARFTEKYPKFKESEKTEDQIIDDIEQKTKKDIFKISVSQDQ